MPVSRMRMRPWLEKMIESNSISGLNWVDKVRGLLHVAAIWTNSCQSYLLKKFYQHIEISPEIDIFKKVLNKLDAQFEWQLLAILKNIYMVVFVIILCWMCSQPLSNSVFPFVFYRIRQCSQFPGSMQLGTAGSWTRTHVCSRSGPSTQVSTPE